MALQEAIEHLDTFGYCIIQNAIPPEEADRMVEHHFRLHQEAENRALLQDPNDDKYQTLFGWLNLDESSWHCAAHPDILALVRHFLGPEARLGEACSKWVKPGAPRQGIHVDSTHDLPPLLPDIPWMINSIWFITDFTKENGATLVAPLSHRLRRRPTPQSLADSHLVSAEGRRGSVLLWHGGVWHGQGGNTTTDQHRMGLNIAYYPPWWNLAREGGHQPVHPEVFERMPPELQELTRHKIGKQCSDIYET
jgi:ectoine hydroxylase-related dioxygenase (phytanoyl-CoA dioxygenase family)